MKRREKKHFHFAACFASWNTWKKNDPTLKIKKKFKSKNGHNTFYIFTV